MPTRTLPLRFLSLIALTVWVGGFTFYGGMVIPELHESLGSVATGSITQRMTDTLNLIGVAAVAAWWLLAVVERRVGSRGFRRTRLGFLLATTALLVFLVVLHRVMDQRLETIGLRGFYPFHRVYLLASTAQWVANLGLLFVALWPCHGPAMVPNLESAPRQRAQHVQPTS